MPTSATDKKAAQIADVEFVLAECRRINELLASTPPVEWKDLSRDELIGSLPHPSGRGDIPCSGPAMRRIWRLAEQALKQSPANRTLKAERVFKALKRGIVDRFVKERRPIDRKQVDRLLASAVRQAQAARSDVVHLIPCRLMYAGKPDAFAIGPVSFTTRAKFNETMAVQFDDYARSVDDPARAPVCQSLLNSARHYYDDFTWVARVEVLNCDARTSDTRAHMAVTAALNFLHALFGAHHTERMNVGGPRLDRDQRARMTLDASGKLNVSCSSAATSAVGFKEGWGIPFEGKRMEVLLRGAAKALEPLIDPSVQRPLGMRLIDAAAWFGDAVREPSPAAQIIKAVTGLEALVMTGEHEGIATRLAARAAAIAYHPAVDKTFQTLQSELCEAYDMRSRLTHGSLSPFNPEVEAYAPVCLQVTEQAICGGLELFESYGMIDKPRTLRELGRAFDQLIEWATAQSATRASARGDTPSMTMMSRDANCY